MIEVIVAIIGLGVGDYADPLELNDKDNEKKLLFSSYAIQPQLLTIMG